MGYKILCYDCLGDGCNLCERGLIYKEGNILDTLTGEGNDVFEQYAFLKDYSILPNSGGIMDQTSRFLFCIRWCDKVNLKMDAAFKEDKKQADSLARKMKNLFKK